MMLLSRTVRINAGDRQALENGRIATHGPAEQLRNDPSVKAAYLGTTSH